MGDGFPAQNGFQVVWTPLRAAGGEIRVANPPSFDSLLGEAIRASEGSRKAR
jgi:hypothetical protein